MRIHFVTVSSVNNLLWPGYSLSKVQRILTSTSYFLFWILISCFFYGCEPSNSTKFTAIAPSLSGLHFTNEITENDSLNILQNEFVYNGAGVAIGDVNGDGLMDLFFAGNQVDNALYLNSGGLTFKEVTELAKLNKPDPLMWSSGVNLLDVNGDGRMDIYVCNTLRKQGIHRRNLLYINQGNTPASIPVFEEMGQQYGLADTSHSSHAQFFDYDNDGDLDLFVGTNVIENQYPNAFVKLKNDGSDINCDKLFQNNWSDSLDHPIFKDVSLEAGLLQDGYSHSTLILDLNEDGWQDIYVANDYESNDLILINNQNGRFENVAGQVFKHFSLSAMGSDVGDINNDGLPDLFTSEMQPYYNKRKKQFQSGSNYQREILTRQYNYEFQYTRNTLQLNQGINPETGLPIFSDVGIHAGVQETDWSWATLLADFDNDGWQDLFVANGFPKDVTDKDFANYRLSASRLVEEEVLLAAIPEIKLPNFLFRNVGGLRFEEVTAEWGGQLPSFSNGAAYGDLDNDGDLDLVVNNIDDPAFLLENKTADNSSAANFLRFRLLGPSANPSAIGASVKLFSSNSKGQHQQTAFLLSGRGYLSASEPIIHFGLGTRDQVDSVQIFWPNGNVSTLGLTAVNQIVDVPFPEDKQERPRVTMQSIDPLFNEVSNQYGLVYKDKEIDFIDFNFQRTVPHKFSQFGPSLAVGDVNGDQLEDLFLGSSKGYPESWFLQQPEGKFLQKEVLYKTSKKSLEEDQGTLLFDADNDGDLDLYIVRGGAQYPAGDSLYQDALLINDGNGVFSKSIPALPDLRSNGSCVKGADFDRDGDIDLFIGSRVLPRAFPLPDRSYLLVNESTKEEVRFSDGTSKLNPDLEFPGLISDALWTDFNKDNWPDLILAGEWMPIRLFENREGSLVEITEGSGLQDYRGWWNSLAAADLDNDGDMDYLAGNYGENTYFQCNTDQPIRVYGSDLDNNGSIDPFISCYWKDSLGAIQEFLYHPMQDVIKQFVGIRKKYITFGEFGEATVPQMLEKGHLLDDHVLTTNWLKTSWIENLGGGKFKMHALPTSAQLAPVFGMLPIDVNDDQLLDILLVGNDHGMETQQGPADALMGLLLTQPQKGQFQVAQLDASQFFVPGDARALCLLPLDKDKGLILASQNNGRLRVFKQRSKQEHTFIPLQHGEVKSKIIFKDGTERSNEVFWGTTYLSQSSRAIQKTTQVKEIVFYDSNGQETRRETNTNLIQ